MNYNFISSKQNNLIKKTASLYKKKFRDIEQLFVVEGLRSVDLVLENNKDLVEYVLVTESYIDKVKLTLDENKVYVCTEEVFVSLADATNAQGILAVCRKKETDEVSTTSLETMLSKKNAYDFVCENLQDPGNAGTLIRTVDSVGADGIIFTNGSVDIYNPKVVRSTVGSILNVNIFENVEVNELIKLLENNNVVMYGTSLDTDVFHDEECYSDKLAIFLGNEANGLTNSTLGMLNKKIKIPMCGKAESLNVGVAGSVVGYEVLRQRRVKNKNL